MALFVLREGFRVVSTPNGGRVVHQRTGDSLDLSPSEVQLLARAEAGGVDPEEPGLKSMARKLAGLGLLVRARPKEAVGQPMPEAAEIAIDFDFAPADEPSAPPPWLEADDLVPAFRADLQSAMAENGLFNVSDPASGKTFQLYDFEISLARMLDGQRRAREVVEAGQRLGIPVSYQSLGQFVRQLERYGFVRPPGEPQPERAEGTTFPPREKWDDSVRQLYQGGLKHFRESRYAEAESYFQAMLEQEPGSREAEQMLAQARAQLAAAPAKAASATAALADPSDEQTEAAALAGFSDEQTETTASGVSLSPARKVRKAALYGGAGAGALAVGIGLAFYLMRDSQPVAPPAPAPQQIAQPAPVASQPTAAAEPASQDAGELAATTPPPQEPAKEPERHWLEAPIAKRGRASLAELRAPAPGQLAWAAPAGSEVAKGEALGSIEFLKPPAPALIKSMKAAAALEKLAKKNPAKAAALESEKQKIAQMQQQRLAQLPLAAPKAGLFAPTAPRKVKKGDKLATVLGPEGFVSAAFKVKPGANWICQIADAEQDRTADCRVAKVASQGKAFLVTAVFKPAWVDAAPKARLRLSAP